MSELLMGLVVGFVGTIFAFVAGLWLGATLVWRANGNKERLLGKDARPARIEQDFTE